MKIRKWTSQQKTLVVLEGLKGKLVGQICSERGIHQSMHYKWRDIFLSKTHKAFEINKPNSKINRLIHENQNLKLIVGDLSLELKKNVEDLD